IQKTSSSSLTSDNVAFLLQAKASSSKHKTSHHSRTTNVDDVDLIHEDLDQIDDLDLEEMDINWQIAMTAIKIMKFYKKTGRRPRVDGRDEFKQVEYKGVPHPLSGDYTPREQEDIDDSLYEYGKYGPQPQSPSPTVSDASSIVFSICPSNDSDGELGAVSDHSVNDAESYPDLTWSCPE
ncbi:hypothetical protein Tco_1545598, partial [Tanacetum coccineum]